MDVLELRNQLAAIYPLGKPQLPSVAVSLRNAQQLENADEAIAAALASVKKRYKFETGKGFPIVWFDRLINAKIDQQIKRQKREGTYRDPNMRPMPANFAEREVEW